ncbi:SARP family transcriptional regulator [Rugosimonospora africana]|uniref:SARP family transcriptional regulator n=1 Tax=Rugosimonospora africana TaxID=556532 RepID=A0A8J3VVJ7_9ACTN|nr:SARP family transcriptional regulator [Rugosimonospora africana]
MRALLVRLALEAGRVVTVGALVDAVWSDGGPADPGHALQALVSRLRGVLPKPASLRAAPGGYRLEVPAESVDMCQFEQLAREGRHALRSGDHGSAEECLRGALALWRADPFPGLDGAVVSAQAARLAELRLSVLEDQLEAELPVRGADLVADAEALAAANPLRERCHALLINALQADGRGAEALAAFERMRQRLADELGVDPGPELRRAHLAALRADSPRPGGNLKALLGGLIGREGEQQQIARRLASGRLVTLIGPGGVGKTRLAIAVAGQTPTPGGVWLVELAAAAKPADVVHAVVAALDLRETGVRHQAPAARLAEALGGRDVLLVLDNCEQVVDAVARLAHELLGRCPRLRILATSREPLGVTGELLVPVLPLDVDTAVQLFTERARAVRPGFLVDEGNAGQVAEVCRRLDGLPLAIELCAARLRTMPLSTVMERLNDRFALLGEGSRTSIPRHQTLSAVVAWSWDLLTGEERAAAQRLAVFRGGFTAEAARSLQVHPGPLVDKSLLQFDGSRYRMLETVREYVLGASHDGEAARDLHAAYFLELATRAAPGLRGQQQLSWLDQLNPERDNFNAALEHACAAGDADTATRLAAALGHFWAIHGEHLLAADRLLAALRVPGPSCADSRAAATGAYLFHAVLIADSARVKSAGDDLQVTDPLAAALLAIANGDNADALAALTPDPRDAWKRGMFGLVRSFVHFNEGDFAAAQRDLQHSGDGFRDAGDRWGLATALTYLAVASVCGGDVEDGGRAIAEAVSVAGELRSDGYQRVWSAVIRLGCGDLDRARTELLDLIDVVSGVSAAMAGLALADLARHAGDLEQAEHWLQRMSKRADPDDAMVQAMVCAGRGQLALDKGALEDARSCLCRAFVLGRDAPDMGMVAVSGVGLAALRLRRADPETAAELLGAVWCWGTLACSLDAARLARELRASLGERAYTRAYDRGRGLDRGGALALIEAQTRRR